MELFLPFQKVEENDDGTLTIWGTASSETLDSQGEVVKADAIRESLPEFFRFGSGALREMHDAKAAGTVPEITIGEDNVTTAKAIVVDSEAIKKVQNGVYKGFSVGGKKLAKSGNIVTKISFRELSLVDRPCNPDCTFSIMKADIPEETEKPMNEELKKFLGEESWDASIALDALNSLYGLLSIEQSEQVQGEEQGSQLADILEAINRIKSFISKEIMEDSTAKSEGSEAVSSEEVQPEEEVVKADVSVEEAKAEEAPVEEVAKAEETEDLEKKGASISASNLEKLQQMHDHAVSMGAKCDGFKKSEQTEDLQKADIEKLEKLEADNDLLKVEVESLKTKVAELEALPAAPKGVLKTLSKSEDIGAGDKPLRKVDAAPVDIIKEIHQSGGSIFRG